MTAVVGGEADYINRRELQKLYREVGFLGTRHDHN
jgi:hypothetical protein